MAKAVKRPAESWFYVLRRDRELDEREQSKFLLAPMTFAQRAAFQDDAIRRPDRIYQSAGDLVLSHVVSIDNFPAGEPQPWPKKPEERQRYIELFDDDLVLELGNEIFAQSSPRFSGAVIKNSFTPEDTLTSGEPSMTTLGSTTAAPASAIPS